MLNQLVEKIYSFDKDKAVEDILDIYKKQWYCIVNFLYFFNLLKFLEKQIWWEKYYNALLNSDLILPDWIALRLYLKRKFWKKVYNLNGTDFVPYFFDEILKKIWRKSEEKSKNNIEKYNLRHKKISSANFMNQSYDNSFSVFLYWAKKEVIKKVYEKYKDRRNIMYSQDWYSNFNWDKISLDFFRTSSDVLPILLVWLWTPKQEIWIMNNLDKIKKYWFIVFWVWWLFDFLAWEEKRAPEIVRKLNLERLWRMVSNPKKNFKKWLWSLKVFKYLLIWRG